MVTENVNVIDITKLNNQKLIDLIIPMYNACDTLTRTLASVVMQTMANNIHVILVQDCDNADYSSIINNFNKLLDIELIKLNTNCGPGTSRRVGMKAGRCKYIMCIDADDTFENAFAVQKLYSAIEGTNCDAINSVYIREDAGFVFVPVQNDWIWMFGKIYRRSFLEENKIEMNDSRANEDTGFNSVISVIGNIGYLPDATYIWHYRENSITRQDNYIYNFTGTEGWIYNMQWAVDNIVRLNATEDKIKQFVANNIVASYAWFLEFLCSKNKMIDIDKYIQWIHKYYEDTYVKHVPTEEQIKIAFTYQSDSYYLYGMTPEYTFEQYLHIIGEGYEKQK